MKIKNILNNSALISLNEKGEELVLIGKGISFQKHAGDFVDESKIEKIFRIHSEGGEKLIELLDTIPDKYFEVTNVIVRYANKKLNGALDKNIYITLFDHINNTIERYKEGICLEFGLLDEIKMLYSDIYQISMWTVDYLNAAFDIELAADEAGFLSVHFLNALRNKETLMNAKKVMSIVHDMLEVMNKQDLTFFKKEGMDYARAVTHMKYLAVRYLRNEMLDDDVLAISGISERKEITKCAQEINSMLVEKYGKRLTNDEMNYLIIHLHRCLEEK